MWNSIYLFLQKEEDFELFHWDDELFGVNERKTFTTKDDDECNRCDMMINHLRRFNNDLKRNLEMNLGNKCVQKRLGR